LGYAASLGTGTVNLSGGALLNLAGSLIYPGNTLNVPAGQNGTLGSTGGGGNGWNGSLAGAANSVLNISNFVSFSGTTSSQFDSFTGTIHILPGATLRFSQNSSGNTYGSLNPAFVINGSLRPRNAGNTIRLGALSGTGSIEGPQTTNGTGNTTYIIGGNNLDVTFDGNISSNSAKAGSLVLLNKIGTGKLTLNGTSTFTGGTTVDAGSLIVNNPTGSGTGSGALSIAAGATLGGTGRIGSATTVDDYAILAPGNSTGTLTFDGSLTLGEFSELNFELGTSNDLVVCNGALSLNGVLNVTNGPGFGPGTYTLFTYNPANGFSFSGLTLNSLPAGYGYSINTATPGQVKLVVSATTPPAIGNAGISGGKLVFSGTGGTPSGTYYVIASTNLATPATNWTRIQTNQFDASGNFAVTNGPATNAQYFYRLQVQ
jgi:fibronectin-binding autotransporter adhesin